MTDALLELRKSYSAGLSGAARDKFDRVAKNYTTGAMDKVTLHAAQGQHDFKVSTNKALMQSTLEDASNEDDPKKRAEQLQLGLSYVRDGNEMNGLTGPAAEQNLADYRSSFHSSVLTTMADDPRPGKAAEAKDYFNAHKSELTHDDKIKMRDMTKQVSLLETVQTKTDEILNKYHDARSGIAAARKEKDAETRKQLTAAVKARYDENEVLRKRELSHRFDGVVSKVMNHHKYTAADIAGFSPAQVTSLGKLETRLAKGEPVVNDPQVYTTLTSSISSMSHNELSDTADNFFALYGDNLDQTHYDRALNYVIAARDAVTKADKTSRSVTTATAVFKSIAQQNKISAKHDPKDWGRLHLASMEAIDDMKAVKGRNLSTAEMTDAIQNTFNDNAMTESKYFHITEKVNLNDGEEHDLSKVFVMVGTDRVYVDNLPQDRLDLTIRSFYAVNGRAPSHQEIAEAYMKKWGNDGR